MVAAGGSERPSFLVEAASQSVGMRKERQGVITRERDTDRAAGRDAEVRPGEFMKERKSGKARNCEGEEQSRQWQRGDKARDSVEDSNNTSLHKCKLKLSGRHRPRLRQADSLKKVLKRNCNGCHF